MKTLPRIAITFSSVALAGLVFAQWQDRAVATTPAPAALTQASVVPAATAPSAAPLVNLPDFSRLVELAGPAVVNIEATIGSGSRRAVAQRDDDDSDLSQQP
ncbi:MAG TPA: hypothetical protein VKM35_06455, partial [Arenimonas sp.]|nr:hypothetical protein [Arenimonas sp.]